MTSLSHVFTSLLPSGLFGNNLDLHSVSCNQNLAQTLPTSLSSHNVFESSGWVPRMEERKCDPLQTRPLRSMQWCIWPCRRRRREADTRSHALVPTHDVLSCARLSDSWPQVHTLWDVGVGVLRYQPVQTHRHTPTNSQLLVKDGVRPSPDSLQVERRLLSLGDGSDDCKSDKWFDLDFKCGKQLNSFAESRLLLWLQRSSSQVDHSQVISMCYVSVYIDCQFCFCSPQCVLSGSKWRRWPRVPLVRFQTDWLVPLFGVHDHSSSLSWFFSLLPIENLCTLCCSTNSAGPWQHVTAA